MSSYSRVSSWIQFLEAWNFWGPRTWTDFLQGTSSPLVVVLPGEPCHRYPGWCKSCPACLDQDPWHVPPAVCRILFSALDFPGVPPWCLCLSISCYQLNIRIWTEYWFGSMSLYTIKLLEVLHFISQLYSHLFGVWAFSSLTILTTFDWIQHLLNRCESCHLVTPWGWHVMFTPLWSVIIWSPVYCCYFPHILLSMCQRTLWEWQVGICEVLWHSSCLPH